MLIESKIESKDNAKLKFARRVRDGKETDHMFIEGRRLCDEALDASLSIVNCFISESFLEHRTFSSLRSKLLSRNFESFVVSESLLNSIADTKSPQGIVLIAKRRKPMELDEGFLAESALPSWAYLYQVNNPSNLGAVVRTAEAAGARGVLLSPSSADPFSPRSVRASMGSAFRLPIVEGISTEKALSAAKEKEVKLAVVHADGSLNYTDVEWNEPRLLVFGSEAEGLPIEIVSQADENIRIPMHSKVESLNLAVSTGIILFEAKRQIELRDD